MPAASSRSATRARAGLRVRQRDAAAPVLLRPFEMADRLVTCGEYAQFIADGGYRGAGLWLSDGWAAVQARLARPAYWLAIPAPG
jgi:formylglycine-generating enzyme required for sulfatase activity